MKILRKETGKTLIEGHRGAEGLGVENSWQAIEEGYLAGADLLEVDVQICKDGALVLHNDYLLPDGKKISDVDVSDLRSVKNKGQDIVFLEQLLIWARDKPIGLSLDIKNGFGFSKEGFHRTLDMVEETSLVDQVMFLSWDHGGLLELKQRNPTVTTRALIRGYPVDFVNMIGTAKVDAVNLSADLATKELVSAFQTENIAVFLGMTFRPDYSLVDRWKLDGISVKDPGESRKAIQALR